ncbi:MbcA/ParS/Xre antitoxin family protein [Acidiphilium cryptum]
MAGGDERSARDWIAAPNSALGARPIDLLASVQGLVDVVAYLDARRASI